MTDSGKRTGELMTYLLRITLKIFGLIALTVWLSLDDRYFTTWLTSIWGIISLIGLLQNEKDQSGQPALEIPDVTQFILTLVLVAVTFIATNWYKPGPRDVVQAGFAIFTVVLYRQGLDWCRRTVIGWLSSLRKNVRSFK